MPDPLPLQSHTVLVTRPAHQAHHLSAEIEKAGGEVIRCPAIEILPPQNVEKAVGALKDLKRFEFAIFVSMNAVESALTLLAPTRLPKTLRLAAIGISTAKCLKKHGYSNIITPDTTFDSENLLAAEAFQNIAETTVAIIRGDSGREWLSDRLREAGAHVSQISAYRRRKPRGSKTVLQNALAMGQLSILSASSDEGLDNIVSMAGDFRPKLLALPLMVLSERNRKHALELGFQSTITVAKQASDKAMLNALIELAGLTQDR